MSTTYTIIVQNDHHKDGRYSVFSEPPTTAGAGTTSQVYTNAWIEKEIPDGGNATIKTSTDIYAWTGTVPSMPAPGVVVENGSSGLANLGNGGANGSSYPMSVILGTPTLGKEMRTAKAGAFEITTDESFTTPNTQYLIGMGKVDNHGIVSPVASILADNNASVTMTPIIKFYVAVSSFEEAEGQIIDFQTATANCGVADFSQGPGLGSRLAVVRHNKNGGFITGYFPAVEENEVLWAVRENRLGEYLSGHSTFDDKKLRTLQSMLGKLSELLNTMDLGDAEPAAANRWIGTVKWPRSVAPAVGIASIVGYLVHKGYKVDYCSTSSSPKGQSTVKFTLTPPGNSGRDFGTVKVDWDNAVAADTQPDGHINEGVHQAPQEFDRSQNSQKRMSLMQIRDVLTSGLEDDGSNGYHNGHSNGHKNGQSNGNHHEHAHSQNNGSNNGVGNGLVKHSSNGVSVGN
ncbi:hypothetical protein CcaCcLH18_03690 [Colletotrichum camelliae]|nr:hypothetical protein CcaCcLH18_03690 [Colletotrichum camelliae]